MAVDPVAIARDLIRCASVTPLDEGAQKVVADFVAPLGFTCHDLPFGNIKNLFARLGSDGPHLCFCGHTDVVPAGDEASWTHPPFAATIEDGWLYGRGAADMKGNIAAVLAGIAAYLEENGPPPGSISLLITGDEEAEAINGTVKVLQWMAENGHTPDAALVCEPSNPNTLGEEIKIGRRGSLTGEITVTGKQGHVAYQHLADNPLPRLIKLLDALSCYQFDQGTEFFDPTNLEITTIDVGNKADNVIPARGMARFNVRYNSNWTAETLEARIREVLNRVGEDYQLVTFGNAESFMTAPGTFTALMQQAVKDITGLTPALTTGGGTSDARFVTHYAPVAEFGLINQTIHQIDERVATSDIESLADIYKTIISRYFEEFSHP